MKASTAAALLFLCVIGLGLYVAPATHAGGSDHGPVLLAQAEGGTAPAAPAAGAAPAASSDATKALWTKNCASCHGETGKADTKTGSLLKVRSMADPAVRATFNKDAMIKATKEGVKKEGSDKLVMKGFGDKLSDAEIAALVDHIYTFGQ